MRCVVRIVLCLFYKTMRMTGTSSRRSLFFFFHSRSITIQNTRGWQLPTNRLASTGSYRRKFCNIIHWNRLLFFLVTAQPTQREGVHEQRSPPSLASTHSFSPTDHHAQQVQKQPYWLCLLNIEIVNFGTHINYSICWLESMDQKRRVVTTTWQTID